MCCTDDDVYWMCTVIRMCHLGCIFSLVFFFKQKTAYEMRISDWSSDVCSSDLYQKGKTTDEHHSERRIPRLAESQLRDSHSVHRRGHRPPHGPRHPIPGDRRRRRSEEHTSELQSLMRISYAVFCLKNKNKNNDHPANTPHQISTPHTYTT